MNRRDLLVAAPAALATSTALAEAAPATPPAGPSGAAEHVQARLLAQRDAWNRGDLVAFCADYADDAVFVSPSGLTRGRAEVFARYEKKYGQAKATMGTLGFEFVDVEAGVDVVAVVMRWSLTFVDKAGASGMTLVVWRRGAAGWRLVQDASF